MIIFESVAAVQGLSLQTQMMSPVSEALYSAEGEIIRLRNGLYDRRFLWIVDMYAIGQRNGRHRGILAGNGSDELLSEVTRHAERHSRRCGGGRGPRGGGPARRQTVIAHE